MSSLKQVTLKTGRENVENEADNKVLGSRGIDSHIMLLPESWEIENQDFHDFSASHGLDVNTKQQKTSSIQPRIGVLPQIGIASGTNIRLVKAISQPDIKT